ncbi:MAG: hemolysin III family protein [Trueperaceae bacterium]|nr:hemolysin III family protein [Trueperaceae bacterium]
MLKHENFWDRLSRYVREPINGISHFIGVLLSIVALILLVTLSQGDPLRVASFAIYGVTSVVLYTASTLLHSLHVDKIWNRRLCLFDHAAIFLLIAGSYTPILLVTLRAEHATLSWTLLSIVWGVALLGIIFKLFWLDAPRWLSTGLYLAMGWLAIIAIVPIAQALSFGGVAWLVAGGIFYSIGAVIFALEKPNWVPGIFGYHELWHMFVLAGSISHFMMMFHYVLPQA